MNEAEAAAAALRERDRLAALIDGDPFFQRHRRKHPDTSPMFPASRSALDVLGHRAEHALITLNADVRFDPLPKSRGLEVTTITSLIMEESVPYLWRAEMVKAARAIGLPRHSVDLRLPHPIMYWLFDSPCVEWMVEQDGSDLTAFTVGVLFVDCDVLEDSPVPDIVLIGVFDWTTKGPSFSWFKVKRGDIYPDGLPEFGRFAIDLLAFLHTPFVEVSTERPPKPPKRSHRGRKTPAAPPLVRVINLRTRDVPRPEPGEGSDVVRWAYRWIVRGHYRAQWYPSTQTHRLIWISPHQKGPDDRPLKVPLYDVMR